MNAPIFLPKRQAPKRVEAWFKVSANVRMDLPSVLGGPDGYIEPDRDIIMGGRAVYFSEPEYGNVFHEMGHMIDIDDRRVRKPGWGLRHGKWKNFPSRYGSGFYEMVTDDAITREMRVMAIQATITEHCGFTFDYLHWADLLSNGAIPNYFLWRTRLGMGHEDERHNGSEWKATTVVDAGILRSMRLGLAIEPLWAEWVRKCGVVDRQIHRVRQSTAA